jgi:hypothetical protein
MPNALTDPGFAANPPVKVNVNARVLGLVIGILATIGAVLSLIGLFAIFGFCTSFGITVSGCGFPIIWLLGTVVGLAGEIMAAIGGFRMYQLNREGKVQVIYGIALAFLGALIGLVGNLVAYSGLIGVGFGGAVIFGFIVDVIIYGVIYYLVVVSRFPGDAPLNTATGGGYRTPPPPPPPSV